MTSSRRSGALAVIPARRGSKGLPLKNMRVLDGLPLVVHSIRAARGATLLDAFVVSTEDDEIAAIAEAEGAVVVRRPVALAADTAQNNPVVRHALESQARDFAFVVLLQPTSPLRRAEHIDASVRLVLDGARSAMTVTAVEHHPGKTLSLEGGLVTPFTSDADMEARRQDLPVLYRQNGAVYAVGVEDFLREDRFYLPPCRAVIMSAEESIDIDSAIDLQLAEHVFQQRRHHV